MQYRNGQNFENVLHFAKTGLGVDPADFLSPFLAFVSGTFKACLSYDIFFRKLTVENVVTGTQAITEPSALVGAVSSATAPLTLAAVISLRSGQKQRYQNGRFYMSGFPVSWVAGDVYNGPTTIPFATMITDYASRFTGTTPSSGFNGVIYTKGKAPFGSGGVGWPQAAIDVATLRFNQIWGTQRRRIPGHGG